MLGEVGYQGLRVEAVAARAGVPRVWLRRWWSTRPLLVAEVLQRMHKPSESTPTGDVRADVRAVIVRTATFLADPLVADALAGLAADAVRDPIAAERLAALLAARRADDTSLLLSAVARGDLRPDTDVKLLLDVAFGAVLFRLGRGTPPTSSLVDELVELVLHGQAVAPAEQPVDGHELDGYGVDGYGVDGYGVDGHGTDGHRTNGHRADGHGTNGHGVNGHGTNGHGVNGHRNGEVGGAPEHDGAAPGQELPVRGGQG
jgi:AcrR family transcriptional regulator